MDCSERQFRRYRRRYEEDGLEGLIDQRLGKASARRIAVDEVMWMLDQYESHYAGWNVKHFHEHLQLSHGRPWSYSWVKTKLQAADLVPRMRRRGSPHRSRARAQAVRGHDAAPGRLAGSLAGRPALDLVVTMDDATSTLYSALLVEEEGTASTFRGLLEVFDAKGLALSLYTDRGSHYFVTLKAGETVDRGRLTQVGWALKRLGIEHIAAYSPQARGRSDRKFGTLQDRLIKELAQLGIDDIETANRWLRDVYLPRHNRRFARPPAVAQSTFVAAPDRTYPGRGAAHPGGTRGRARQHRDLAQAQAAAARQSAAPSLGQGARARAPASRRHLALFHGPSSIGRYDAQGRQQASKPIASRARASSVPPRAGPGKDHVARRHLAPATRSRACARPRTAPLTMPRRTRPPPPDPASQPLKRTIDVLQKPDNLKS